MGKIPDYNFRVIVLSANTATINLQGLQEFTVDASRGKNEHIAGKGNPSARKGETNSASPSNDLPVCTWRGTAPACNGKCLDTEINVASDESGGGHCKIPINPHGRCFNLIFGSLLDWPQSALLYQVQERLTSRTMQ